VTRWTHLFEAVVKRMGDPPLPKAWLRVSQAIRARLEGDWVAMARYEREALELKIQALGPNDSDVALSWGNVAESLSNIGKPNEALQANSKALEIQTHNLGEHHPSVGMNRSNRGEILFKLGRTAEAATEFQKAIDIFSGAIGESHPFLGYPLYGSGLCLMRENRIDQAIARFERALSIRLQAEPDAARVAEVELSLAEALYKKGGPDRGRALSLARQAEDRLAKTSQPSAQLAETRKWLKDHPPT